MPLWREKRLNCFYCGCRSARALPADTRRWQCTRCEAVNHLDEDGEITDPPTAASQPETRFARSRPRPESPSGLNAEADTPFCQRCLNNQRITNDILANYVPPETRDWERQYKQHVKALQETYPPVCDDCEDRIRSKMQQSDYFVSAENLGRSLLRDNGSESWLCRRGWQYNLLSLILTLGKLMWWTSWVGQFLWHALNLVQSKRHLEHRLEIGTAQPPYDCFPRIFSLAPLPATCDDFFTSLAGWSLVLGLLSIWWNPMWVKKLQLIYGRAMNKMEYYELQVIFLLVRWALWASFEKIASMDIGAQRWKGFHAFAMAICLLSAVLPLRAIKWDSTPRIGRSYSPGSLLAQKPREPRRLSRPRQPNFVNQAQSTPDRGRSERMNQRFPIDRLATTPQQHFTPRNIPPTPPPEEDDEAAMDWQPSQQFNFQPTTSYRDSRQTPTRTNTQKSPFYGQLPPNVVSPAHALRNPPYQPAPLQRASAQQNNFFNRNDATLSHPFGNRIFDDDESSMITSPAKSTFSPIGFQNQKFFPRNVNDDTGLEDLFAKATTLKHDPNHPTAQQGDGDYQDSPTEPISEEHRSRQARAATRASRLKEPILHAMPTILAIIVLALAVQLVFYENFVGDLLLQGVGKVRCMFGGEECG